MSILTNGNFTNFYKFNWLDLEPNFKSYKRKQKKNKRNENKGNRTESIWPIVFFLSSLLSPSRMGRPSSRPAAHRSVDRWFWKRDVSTSFQIFFIQIFISLSIQLRIWFRFFSLVAFSASKLHRLISTPSLKLFHLEKSHHFSSTTIEEFHVARFQISRSNS